MSNAAGGPSITATHDRIAGAPISWGVCEVPGWGLQLEPDRVLAEMRSLGIAATEAGPEGYLGTDAAAVSGLLARHGISLVGGFLPIVLHDPERMDASLAKVRRTAALFAETGARLICSAVVVDDGWSRPIELDDGQWDLLARGLALVDAVSSEHGVRHVLHPHWGTLVESAASVRRALTMSDVEICLDTGHLALGGLDPLEIVRSFPDRIGHVHLKDVRESVAARLRAGELSLVEAVRHGLFQPLGTGDLELGDVLAELEGSGYTGWYVLEQDVAILGEAPTAGAGPIDDVRRSISFLERVEAATHAVRASEGR